MRGYSAAKKSVVQAETPLIHLAIGVSGCLSTVIPFLVSRVHSVDWDLVLWVDGLPQQLKKCDLTRGRYKVP